MEVASGIFNQHLFEVISTIIATVALVYAALAFKAAKQAIRATRESDIIALRVVVQESIAHAESSLVRLHEACHSSRDEWEIHECTQRPVLGQSHVHIENTRNIGLVERSGSNLLDRLLSSAPNFENANTLELEEFIKRAKAAAVEIGRLKLRLKSPKPYSR